MLQLALLGSGSPDMVKGSGAGAAGSGGGINGLLHSEDGQMAGFSGELQAMLMQMSPQMLQQLEELLAGGMPLPQAARSLLTEAGYGSAGELFGSLLEQGLSDIQEQLQIDGMPRRSAADGTLAKLAGNLLAGSQNGAADLLDVLSAPMSAAIPGSAQNTVSSALPPQLAASLLGMGVPPQVGGKGWDGAIADRVMWMVQGEQQFAKLRLNPPNLGPLEVRVTLNQDQASVSFLAQHAAVREALEAALPRLREMFDQQSLQLVRADVSDPGAQQGGGTGDPSAHPASQPGLWGPDVDEGSDEEGIKTASAAADNLVDLFA
jgi:flagellar hook-length control protein FliK